MDNDIFSGLSMLTLGLTVLIMGFDQASGKFVCISVNLDSEGSFSSSYPSSTEQDTGIDGGTLQGPLPDGAPPSTNFVGVGSAHGQWLDPQGPRPGESPSWANAVHEFRP